VITAAHTSRLPGADLLPDLVRVLRSHLRRPGRPGHPAQPSMHDALFGALCHDMNGSLSSLEQLLRQLAGGGPQQADLLEVARSQAAHLSSILRTAEATGGTPPRHALTGRPLRDVVAASVAASGLPREQLTVRLGGAAGEITVGDARLQRILINLLENAHRHGNGEPVLLEATSRDGWVQISVRQSGVPSDRVVPHLRTSTPPRELTGLGLWSVQRQTRELGGCLDWDDDGSALTLTIHLPDR
jgi:signal transduction histidine kinase